MLLGLHPSEGVQLHRLRQLREKGKPKVVLDTFIDDIQTAAAGSEEAAVMLLTEATEDLSRVVEHEI